MTLPCSLTVEENLAILGDEKLLERYFANEQNSYKTIEGFPLFL